MHPSATESGFLRVQHERSPSRERRQAGCASATVSDLVAHSTMQPLTPVRQALRRWGGRLALLVAAVVGLAWPDGASACSTKNQWTTSIAAKNARSVFIGDVAFIYRIRLRRGEQVIAHVIRVRTAWMRALPAYVVLERAIPGYGRGGSIGDRMLFAFPVDGHVGLDIPVQHDESDPQGWVWRGPGCGDDHAFGRIDEAEVDPKWGIEFLPHERVGKWSRRGTKGAYMHTYQWKPDKARRMLELREKQLIVELTQLFGPPQTVPTAAPLADFANFAGAYMADANAPPWPAPWEYYMAAAFQLTRLLGDDETGELVDAAVNLALLHGFLPESWRYFGLGDNLDLVARWSLDLVLSVHPIFDWKAVLSGQVRLLSDLISQARMLAQYGYRTQLAQEDLVWSAMFVARMPRNWSEFPFGIVDPSDVSRRNWLLCRSKPDPACVWLKRLVERHQAALADLGMAYLRAQLLRAGVPAVDGTATVRAAVP